MKAIELIRKHKQWKEKKQKEPTKTAGEQMFATAVDKGQDPEGYDPKAAPLKKSLLAKFCDMHKCMKAQKSQHQESLEKKQGMKTGLDPKKFERCVLALKREKGVDNPYAICNASVGEKK